MKHLFYTIILTVLTVFNAFGQRAQKYTISGFMNNSLIDFYFSDDWGAYARYLPEDRHYIGKDQTWKIERKNLNFRIHLKRLNRRTICYSKSEEVHDNVIGMYIERYYFKTGLFRNAA